MNKIEAQRNAIQDRGEWAKERGRVMHEVQEMLVRVALEDFRHQVGPRGCDDYAGYGEAVEENRRMVDALHEQVREDLQQAVSRFRNGERI